MSRKAVVVLSGGMDSFTTLHCAIQQWGGKEVAAFSLNYGQRHVRELRCAAKVTHKLGILHEVVHAAFLRDMLRSSSLTSEQPVPKGHYTDISMKQTVVPNRNMILLSLAIGFAVTIRAREVWTGMHQGDHAIYPDCRPEFVDAMRAAARIANYEPVSIVTPFLNVTKADILSWGLANGVTVGAYADTHTCYEGREVACGRCGACVERLESFSSNSVTDPIAYEAAT